MAGRLGAGWISEPFGSGFITFRTLGPPEQRDDAVEKDIFHFVEQDQAAVGFGQDLRAQQIGAEPELLLLQVCVAAVLQGAGVGEGFSPD